MAATKHEPVRRDRILLQHAAHQCRQAAIDRFAQLVAMAFCKHPERRASERELYSLVETAKENGLKPADYT